ncbi:Aldo/keto reductase [Pyrenophora tritici-repentis]|nr:Aldo/keto reductase [Pyrenophora tritici-repentis]
MPTHFTLNTGAQIIGFGTWQAKCGEVERAVEIVLKISYRHIGCAVIYGVEAELRDGIRRSGVPHSNIFLTSSLWNFKPAQGDVEGALDKSLQDHVIEYLGSILHALAAFNGKPGKWSPLRESGVFDLVDIDSATAYKAMKTFLPSGKICAIGVSNFMISHLNDLLSKTDVPALFKSKGILVGEAYSPLGNNPTGEPRTVADKLVGVLGRRLGLDGGLGLASWGIQRGTVVLPKSFTPSRIKSNMQVKELPPDAFDQLGKLERHKRFNVQSRWGNDIFEELGDE